MMYINKKDFGIYFFKNVLACILVLTLLSCSNRKDSAAIPNHKDSIPNAKDDIEEMRLATFNMRSSGGSDKVDWESIRLYSVLSLFKKYKFDIVGMQEPKKSQIDDLMETLGDKYNYFVRSTQNGKTEATSHSNPIFYNQDRFDVKDSGVFWFSETPDVPGSESWNASQPRNCIWMQLYDKINKVTFFVFNSHFDHISDLAKEKSAELLVKKIREIAKNQLVICTGDFNSGQDSRAVSYLITISNLLNATHSMADSVVNDDYKTAHAYKELPPDPNAVRIDHIFISKNYHGKVLLWECIIDNFYGNWASDHYPIFIDFYDK